MSKLSLLLDQAFDEIEASEKIQALGSDTEMEDSLVPLSYEAVAEFELIKQAVHSELSMDILTMSLEGCDDFVKLYKDTHAQLLEVMRGKPLSTTTRQDFLQKNRKHMIDSIAEFLSVSHISQATAIAIAEELLE